MGKTITETHKLYKGKVEILYYPTSHRYKLDGSYLEGVTTALSIVNKPQLMSWASKMAVEVFVDYYDAKALWNKEEFKAICKEARAAHVNYKDARAEVGLAVHDWIEAHIAGTDNIITPDIALGVASYLEFEKQHKPKYKFSERVIYSKAYNYAGRVDSGMILDDMYGIVDFKTGTPDREYSIKTKRYTGKYRAYNTHLAQVGGYDVAISEEDSDEADFYGVVYLDALEGRLWFFRSYHTDHWADYYITALKLHRLNKQSEKVNFYE